MAIEQKSYKQLKAELDEVLSWFEQDDIDIDLALKQYQKASELIVKLEKLIESASLEVTKLGKK